MIGGDWTKVEPIQEGKRGLPAGGYVVKIIKVDNVAAKSYLLIEYDIAEGEHTGHYKELNDRFGFWGGSFIRSYKANAAGFFKAFLDAVEASNFGVKLATETGVDERKLPGLLVGVVLREEEYIKNNGELGTRLRVKEVLPVDRIRMGDFIVPEKKVLDEKPAAAPAVIDTTAANVDFESVTEDLPF